MEPNRPRAVGGVPRQVAGVALPRRRHAHAAADAARASLPAALVRHAYRAWLFGMLTGRRLGVPAHADLLFVAAHFAHMGLSARHAQSAQRYELDGADAARAFLDAQGVRRVHGAAVWSAISLHTSAGIADRASALGRLLACGVRADLFGEGLDCASRAERDEIAAVFPRGREFPRRYLEALARGLAHRPETSFGTFGADVLERFDPAFNRANFCGRVLGARWDLE